MKKRRKTTSDQYDISQVASDWNTQAEQWDAVCEQFTKETKALTVDAQDEEFLESTPQFMQNLKADPRYAQLLTEMKNKEQKQFKPKQN